MVEPIFKERDELEIETVHSDGEFIVKVAISLSCKPFSVTLLRDLLANTFPSELSFDSASFRMIQHRQSGTWAVHFFET